LPQMSLCRKIIASEIERAHQCREFHTQMLRAIQRTQPSC
jgi:ribosomal protein L40E